MLERLRNSVSAGIVLFPLVAVVSAAGIIPLFLFGTFDLDVNLTLLVIIAVPTVTCIIILVPANTIMVM